MAGMQDVEAAIGEADASALRPSRRRPAASAAAASRMASWLGSRSVRGETARRRVRPTVSLAVPRLPTTTPAAALAMAAAAARSAPAASASANAAITVSPAPETSNTSRALRGNVAALRRRRRRSCLFRCGSTSTKSKPCAAISSRAAAHDLVVVETPRARPPRQARLPIGRDRGGAGIAGIVAALGIDQHRLVRPRGRSRSDRSATPSSSMPLP